MEYICKICGKNADLDSHFWRTHRTKIADYFHKYEPRYDKLTGDIIKFKSRDFYLNSSFNDKKNLKIWLNQVTKADAQKYIEDSLTTRKLKKGLIYSPTQIELRSLPLPGIKWIIENIGDYYDFCSKLGLLKRFSQYSLDKKMFKDISKKVIFADKREQKPLEFNLTTRHRSMSFGDYRCVHSDVFIERKSLADLFSTMGYDYERFEREVQRAKEADSYLVVLVEEPFDNIYEYPYRSQVRNRIKISSEVPLFHIRDLIQRYTNLQFLFVKDRNESSRVIELIFSAGEQVKKVDLQYLWDTNQL